MKKPLPRLKKIPTIGQKLRIRNPNQSGHTDAVVVGIDADSDETDVELSNRKVLRFSKRKDLRGLKFDSRKQVWKDTYWAPTPATPSNMFIGGYEKQEDIYIIEVIR